MQGDRSKTGIVQSKLDVKTWLSRPPSAEEVRPGWCPLCETPSRRPGQPLSLWGHGLRDRHVEGPPAPGDVPADVAIAARRYQCQVCWAVVLVVPRAVLPRRRYTAAAIAWALALWGHGRRPAAEVRRRTSTTPAGGFGDPNRWASLPRWVAATLRGELFARAGTRRVAAGGTVRQIAGRIAIALAAHALPTVRRLSLEVQAFHGGVAMA